MAANVLEWRPSNSGGSKSLRGNDNNEVYLRAVSTQGGRDLVEEFGAADILPLRHGWGFNEFAERSIPLTGNFVIFPKFEVNRDHLVRLDFIDYVERRVLALVGKYTLPNTIRLKVN